MLGEQRKGMSSIKKFFVIGILVLGIFFSCFSFYIPQVSADSENWYNTDWGYRKLITINASKVGGTTLKNFPVLVYCIMDKDNVQSDGGDICFISYSDNATKYNHEIETYWGGVGSGELLCWVNITSVSGSVNTKFWMYYGNPGCSNQWNNLSTWDSNYIGVYHISYEGDLHDSTGHVNLTNYPTSPVDWIDFEDFPQLGWGFYFNSVDDKVYLSSNVDLGGTLTGEMWFKRVTSPNAFTYLFCEGTTYTSSDWCVYMRDAAANFRYVISSVTVADGGTLPSNNFWHRMVCTWNDTSNYAKIRRNASEVYSYTTTTAKTDSNTILYIIGSSGTGANARGMTGYINELRLSNIDRTPSYLNAGYNNTLSPSSFMFFGSEEEVPRQPVVYVDDDFDSGTPGWNVTCFDNIEDGYYWTAAGGVLYVWDGSYDDVIVCYRGINFVGNGSDVVNWHNAPVSTSILITISSSVGYMNISGFNFSDVRDYEPILILGGVVKIFDNVFYDNDVCIKKYYASGLTNITNNRFIGVTISNNCAISLVHSDDVLIYNNFFNYTHDVSINIYIDSMTGNDYDFNISKILGTNIIGTSYIGGNYWDDNPCRYDVDGFSLPLPITFRMKDYLPLMNNTNLNPDVNLNLLNCTEVVNTSWWNGTGWVINITSESKLNISGNATGVWHSPFWDIVIGNPFINMLLTNCTGSYSFGTMNNLYSYYFKDTNYNDLPVFCRDDDWDTSANIGSVYCIQYVKDDISIGETWSVKRTGGYNNFTISSDMMDVNASSPYLTFYVLPGEEFNIYFYVFKDKIFDYTDSLFIGNSPEGGNRFMFEEGILRSGFTVVDCVNVTAVGNTTPLAHYENINHAGGTHQHILNGTGYYIWANYTGDTPSITQYENIINASGVHEYVWDSALWKFFDWANYTGNTTPFTHYENIINATGIHQHILNGTGYYIWANYTGDTTPISLIENIINVTGTHEYILNNTGYNVWANYTGNSSNSTLVFLNKDNFVLGLSSGSLLFFIVGIVVSRKKRNGKKDEFKRETFTFYRR